MSPIDVDSSTIGFPFPAAVAAPGRPSPRTRIPSSAERQNVIVAVPFREREVTFLFPHAPRARKGGSEVVNESPDRARRSEAPAAQGATTSHSRRLWRGGATPRSGMHRPPGDGRGFGHGLSSGGGRRAPEATVLSPELAEDLVD